MGIKEVRAGDRKLKINFARPNIPTKCINGHTLGAQTP